MTTPSLILKRGHMKPLFWGHPWVFAKAVDSVSGGKPESGDVVRIVSQDGQFIGMAFYQTNNAIAARMVSRNDIDIDDAFIRQRVESAIAFRKKRIDPAKTNAFRLINSEGDGLPGLVVDQYGDVLSAQFHSAAMTKRVSLFEAMLLDATGAKTLIDSSDKNLCNREKIPAPLKRSVIAGDELTGEIEYIENGLRYSLDMMKGQKTGAYLDQRENRARAAELGGGDVLDVCCHTGGFALNLLKSGKAGSVAMIDSSLPVLEGAEANIKRNGFDPEAAELLRGDGREVMEGLVNENRQFNTVIIDPPKLAPTRASVPKAESAYIGFNTLALKLLNPGGLLVSCCCSGNIDLTHYEQIVSKAAADAGCDAAVIERRGAGIDHPTPAGFSEGAYLKVLMVSKV
ncbi:MAG: class I SAM-dependent rRNA methyltransferase [Planctomycetota bacterium]